MLRLFIPVGVTVLLIGLATWREAIYSDRWATSSVSAEDFGQRFELVPRKVGPWVGEDKEETQEVLEMAGAVRHVSRTYVNSETNARVDLWLVVGHSRDICRHTPDICYPGHGFSQLGSRLKQRIDVPGEPPATFFTAKFRDESALGGQQVQRVFWAWNGNEEGKDVWDAPEYQKQYYGNNTALYKMYFTASMKDLDEPVEDSAALEFGKLMIPAVNRALFPDRYQDRAPGEGDDAEGDKAEASALETPPSTVEDAGEEEGAPEGSSAVPAAAKDAAEPAK
jgi:hypothetical protein